jgi:hypothetical protein
MKGINTSAGKPRRMRPTVRVLGADGALAWIAMVGAQGEGAGTAEAADTAALVAEDAPGYVVENFNYPQADKILAEQNIVLKRGDGHIPLADCATGTGQLEPLARDRDDRICFNTVGTPGHR